MVGSTNVIERVRDAQQRHREDPSGRLDADRTKRELHVELIESLDFEQVGKMPREELEIRLREILVQRVEARNLPLSRMEREWMVQEILDEVLGYGPLEPILKDGEITDILVNGFDKVWIEKGGKLSKTRVRFQSNQHLMQIIDRIVTSVGRRIDETTPMVDARLPDGSRVNAIIPPLALDGPMLSIRRFGAVPITASNLVALKSIPREIMDVLQGCVQAKLNILISGGTGSGKNTLLNVLSAYVPASERIVTIEDSAELKLQQEHVVRLETRPPNLEGRGQVTQRDLVRNALRMRPDRIILGEIRGAEAMDMLQAMNTGHEGSLSTIHANGTRDALARLEAMVGMDMPNMADRSIRQTIARAIDVIIQVDRLIDGTRRLITVTEIVGMESAVISTQDIFKFEQVGLDAQAKVHGAFAATGTRPRFAEKLKSYGVDLSPDLFRFRMEV
ncbi:MAG: CpaF family protein [Deltaproteobacteria bacterium]|nr:CpaF family protein [Deltaproteobacteria bacterium]